jgi:hypothetical protein
MLEQQTGIMAKIRRKLLFSKRSIVNLQAWQLYLNARKQSELKEWQDLGDSFLIWYNLMMLHLWLVFTRLRSCEPKLNHRISHDIINKFWRDVNFELMAITNVGDKLLVSKYRKQLFPIYWGTMLAYDEGMYKGDPVLADALWRYFLFSNFYIEFFEFPLFGPHFISIILHD